MDTATGQSLANSEQTPYTIVTNIPIPLNRQMITDVPFVVASGINETKYFSGNKSLVLTATLSTGSNNISPVIDSQNSFIIARSNRIDNSEIKLFQLQLTNATGFDIGETIVGGTSYAKGIIYNKVSNVITYYQDSSTGCGSFTNGETITNPPDVASTTAVGDSSAITTTNYRNPIWLGYVGDTSSISGGTSSLTKYITRRVDLNEPASSLKSYVYVSLPGDASIELYYKVRGVGNDTNFDDIGWTLVNSDNPIIVNDNPENFDEAIYTLEDSDIGIQFSSFAIKIIMKSINSSKIPIISDFRAIALT